MTSFATLEPVAEALWPAAEKFLGHSMNWIPNPGNYLQELVVAYKEPALKLALTLDSDQLSAIASNICQKVNDYLEANKFSFRLRDEGPTGMFYAASVMKLFGEFFQEAGTGYWLRKIGKPAMRFSKQAGVRHFRFDGKPLVVIPTNGGFSLLVTEPTKATGFDMLPDWEKMLHGMKETVGDGAVLPMSVVNEMSIDVSALHGMRTLDPWIVEQALMAARFALTPKYVKFEAAFAYSSRKGIDQTEAQPDDFVADFPPYIALVKSGHWLPLATGLIDVNDLSDQSEFKN